MEKCIFTVIALIGIFLQLVLFGVATQTWDGICDYKVEYGLIAFYRVAHEGVTNGMCSTGLLPMGVVFTALASISILIVIYFSWSKLIKSV